MNNFITKKISILILSVLALFAIGGFIGFHYFKSTTPATDSDNQTVDELAATFTQSALEGRNTAIAQVGDPAFSLYVSNVLDKECPFYQPNGVEYRDCLSKIATANEASYTKRDPPPDEIDKHCESVSNIFGNLLAIEMYSSCEAFEFSKN